MTAGSGQSPGRGQFPGTAATAERQAREARLDAERYARRGNREMHAVSLRAAKDLEASAAAHREARPARPLKGDKG